MHWKQISDFHQINYSFSLKFKAFVPFQNYSSLRGLVILIIPFQNSWPQLVMHVCSFLPPCSSRPFSYVGYLVAGVFWKEVELKIHLLKNELT